MHSWGLRRHTHPETSREWAPPAPALLGPSHTAAALGFQESYLGCPLLVPSGLQRAVPKENRVSACLALGFRGTPWETDGASPQLSQLTLAGVHPVAPPLSTGPLGSRHPACACPFHWGPAPLSPGPCLCPDRALSSQVTLSLLCCLPLAAPLRLAASVLGSHLEVLRGHSMGAWGVGMVRRPRRVPG